MSSINPVSHPPLPIHETPPSPLHEAIKSAPLEKLPEKKAEKKTAWEEICTFFANLFTPKEPTPPQIEQKRHANESVSFTPKITIDPIRHSDSIQKQIDYTKDLQEEQNELELSDAFWLAKEAGLDRKWLEIQVRGLNLKGDMNRFDQAEIVRIQNLIKSVATKIEELQKERLEKAENSRWFGKFESTSFLLNLATTIVIGSMLLLYGAVPGILAALGGISGMLQGGVSIAKALTDHSLQKIEGQLLGNREERNDYSTWTYSLVEEVQERNEERLAAYKRMAEVERNKNRVLQMVQR